MSIEQSAPVGRSGEIACACCFRNLAVSDLNRPCVMKSGDAGRGADLHRGRSSRGGGTGGRATGLGVRLRRALVMLCGGSVRRVLCRFYGPLFRRVNRSGRSRSTGSECDNVARKRVELVRRKRDRPDRKTRQREETNRGERGHRAVRRRSLLAGATLINAPHLTTAA
jgi:hypothetical protein